MSTLLGILAADIVPIFLVASAGFILARWFGANVQALTQVVFYALLPCLIFRMLFTSSITGTDVGRLVGLAALTMILTGVAAYATTRILRLDRPQMAAFMLVAMFSNGGNYGLPVVSFAFGAAGLAYATIYFLTGSVMTNTIGGFLAAAGRREVAGALKSVLKMPSLYGLTAALVMRATGAPLPIAIERPVSMLADSALPLMIVILGMQLQHAAHPKRPGLVLAAVALSLIGTPLIALGLAPVFGITGAARQAAVTLASMPVAVSTSILALKYDAEPDFVTAAVFLSTLLSPLTLTPIIAFLK